MTSSGRLLALSFALVALLALSGGRSARGDDAPPSPADALLQRAREAAFAKDTAAALPLYMQAIRKAEEYGTKYVARAEVLALPHVPARPLSPAEEAIVTARIAEERERDVTRKAGGFEWTKPHVARLLHQRLRELAGLDERQQDAHKDAVDRIDHRLTEEATEAEKTESKAVEGDLSKPEELFAKAGEIAREGRPRVAIRILRAIVNMSAAPQATKDKAAAEADALRKRTCEEIAPEEKQAADEIWEDPHWKGLGTSQSHEFIFIGAKEFVSTIAPADRIKMDLACVLLGDLVGRDLTGDGQRLTIYYKERFDFGGGIGGGKRIDIGNKAIAKPIAGPLHYHELSHCTFDVGIVYPGFTEGIANFGAVFALDAMGQPTEADAAIKSNRDSFQADYLDRRMRYFRIQSYAPSCGFLLTPITAKDPEARKGEWATYRRFFRMLRAREVDDPRDTERIRHFAWNWGQAFGWTMLDEAAKDRFPVVPEDKERVAEEYREWLEKTNRGEAFVEQGYAGAAIDPLEMVIAAYPKSELADRCRFALAAAKHELGDDPARDALYAELGVISKWKMCGPFYSRHGSVLHAVFEPERTIDLAAQYPNAVQNSFWKDAKNGPDGKIDFIEQGYAYPDHAAVYCLAYVEVPKEVPDAVVSTGFDDACALWVNGELAEKWDETGRWIFDHHATATPLKAGKNRLLWKVCNVSGAWSFSARIARADHTPIEGLKFLPVPAKDVPEAVPEPKGHAVFQEDFEKAKSLAKGRFKPTVGGWAIDQKCLRRTASGNVLWRKFTIQPFVSKDPPSALVWLGDKDLATLQSFAVEVTVHRPNEGACKFACTLHGEEKDDGLSGHTFLVEPGGDGFVVRLEEYDRLVYWGTVEATKSQDHVVRFVRRGRTLSCSIDGKPVLSEVDLPPLPHTGIGLMTWDKETGFAKIRVERLPPEKVAPSVK